MHSFLDHTRAPASIVSDTCLAYYRRVAANPYIQHVLPGFRLSLQTTEDWHSPKMSSPTDDQVQSERVYWETVAANVPVHQDNMGDTCAISYGTNTLCLMFAFAHGFGGGYGIHLSLDLTMDQAMALHQSSGLVDSMAYIWPTTTLARRVVWFGQIYHPLVTFYAYTRRFSLFVPTTIVCDLIHHLIHACASTWRFGIVEPHWVVLSAKIRYHVLHWISLLLSIPSFLFTKDATWNTRVCHYWRTSHVSEIWSHLQNRACTIVPIRT